ncbi:MAG: hypothetical protein EXS18_03535 [Verrucomicrobiae bacterium]|nr:hypothetical protein [Verrucomicrobiae bacterium]
MTPEGEPLGRLDAQCWARDPKQFGKKHRRRRRPLGEKESRPRADPAAGGGSPREFHPPRRTGACRRWGMRW